VRPVDNPFYILGVNPYMFSEKDNEGKAEISIEKARMSD